MTAAVFIETMTEEDVPTVAALDVSSRMGETQLHDELARPWSRVWVAHEEADVISAFLVAWHVVDELHVLNVSTRVDKRRRGLGRALMDYAVRYAREQHLARLLLEVRRSNHAAIALYRSTGFFATHVRSRYYPDDEDALEMVLLLDPQTGEVLSHEDEVAVD